MPARGPYARLYDRISGLDAVMPILSRMVLLISVLGVRYRTMDMSELG